MPSRGNYEYFLGSDEMLDRIKALCEANGTNINQLEAKCGLSTGAIRHWNISIPKADKAYLVAKELGVSMEYLVTGIKNSPAGNGGLSEGDANILWAYHKATPADRQIIDNIVSRYLPGCAEAVQRVKFVPLFGTSAAAGPGEPDTELPWENYEVPEDSRAEFAVRITGDSMTPVLADGEVALCQKRRPQVGDLAVIMVNGALLVKQYTRDNYGNVYLRSLNRARRDCDYDIMASGNDTVMCYGTVLLNHRVPLADA